MRSTLARLKSRPRHEKGYVLALLVLLMSVILLMIGFAVDVGSWYLQTSRLQRAADSSALAGAISLPNIATASSDVDAALARNGYVNGQNSIQVTKTIDASQVETEVTDSNVTTYFTGSLFSHLTISRKSIAQRGTSAPVLGSPFNYLGTGDLTIPNIPKQNFWLAINGACSSAEDGDLYNSQFDGTKGPFDSSIKDAKGNFAVTPSAQTNCPGADVAGGRSQPNAANPYSVANPSYTPNGYDYFIDVPQYIGGHVAVEIYDGQYSGGNPPDAKLDLPMDVNSHFPTTYLVYDTHNTPDDPTDDGAPVAADTFQTGEPSTVHQWIDLYDIPTLATATQTFRVQVVTYNTSSVYAHRGINAFSIGAVRSWAAGGCDSRAIFACPRVYGRGVISVYNNLSGVTQADFYFAQVGANYAGQTFNIYLWDPGEGVQDLKLLGPDGTPLAFNWVAGAGGLGLSGTNTTVLNTSLTGGGPNKVQSGSQVWGASNDYLLNDRLVTITVTIPLSYMTMVQNAGGDDFLRIHYDLTNTPSDRTTWGISMSGGAFSPPHLVRLG